MGEPTSNGTSNGTPASGGGTSGGGTSGGGPTSNAEVAAEMNSAVAKVLEQIGNQIAQYRGVRETQLEELRRAVGGKESVQPAITGLEASIEVYQKVAPKLTVGAENAEKIRVRVLA